MLRASISFSSTPMGSSNSNNSGMSPVSFTGGQEVRMPGEQSSKRIPNELLISWSPDLLLRTYCPKRLSQHDGTGATQLLHFFDQLLRRSHPLREVGAHAQAGSAVLL